MKPLTRAHIVTRFGQDLGPPLLRGDGDLNPGQTDLISLQSPARDAAVFVGFVDRPGGLTLLLTKRTEQLKRHPGQIAFPGGSKDPGDTGPAHTALREAGEEVGLREGEAELVTTLPPYRTVTGFDVTPVLGFIDPAFKPVAEPGEVAEIFEVEAAHALHPDNHRLHSREWQGRTRHFYSIENDRHTIWGATAAMLVNISTYLRGDG